MEQYLPLIVAIGSSAASVAVLLRARSEIRKNSVDATKSAFDLLSAQLKSLVETNGDLQKEIVGLRNEVSLLRARIIEIETILDEIKRTVPKAVSDAIMASKRRSRRPQ